LLAGASTIQVGTQNFIDPATAERVVREIEDHCRAHAVFDVQELVGKLVTDR
jgi:dihydroorotate dehydrogenase (NAD+) catalytic subunit